MKYSLQALPTELKSKKQWCIAGKNKAPFVVKNSNLYPASPTTGPWLDFSIALGYATTHSLKIGFVLTKDDPFTCIDLDVKDCENQNKDGTPVPSNKWTTLETLISFQGIIQLFNSYAEISTLGKGVHVWVKGNIPQGRRKGGIEIYSSARFIICTGSPVSRIKYNRINNVVIPVISESIIKPIEERQGILDNIISNFSIEPERIDLEEIDANLTDSEIWKRSQKATNAEKFKDLCNGEWQKYPFPSQSEADLALLSMFTFYSKSNSQCVRMFRQTILGQRNKATKNSTYVDRTLKIIRSRQSREDATEQHSELISAAFIEQLNDSNGNSQPVNERGGTKNIINTLVARMQQRRAMEHVAPASEDLPIVDGLEWPPGLVGAIAGFVYGSAPRPVKEVAIVSALGFMAGIVGKSYNIGQTGLNLYIILIAQSGVGKEAMHSGIGHILQSGEGLGGDAKSFINFTDFASGPALTKAFKENQSFVNVAGEWGRKLRRLSLEENNDGPMQQLRTVMTDLYQKSGPASIVGGLTYSNKEKDIASLNGVAYSMIGETTPGTFYQSITATMLEDGFLSRFITVEYEGERPPTNPNVETVLPENIGKAISEISKSCIRLNQYKQNILVQYDEESAKLLKNFDLTCDANINAAGKDEALRQLWNRAHLKVCRIAAILAVSDNHINPIVVKIHANWALYIVIKDISRMNDRIMGGSIGLDDDTRYRKILQITKKYLLGGGRAKSYNIHPAMRKNGIIPRRYLQMTTHNINAFKVSKRGSTAALNCALKVCVENGNFIEVNENKLVEMYGFHGRAFRVVDLPDEMPLF